MNGPFTPVRPGDLISSDFFNRLIDAYNKLDARVSALEQVGSTSKAVSISAVFPSGALRVGQEIQVLGRNFAVPAPFNIVSVDGILVEQFNAGSDDRRLLFYIPAVQGVPKTATLTVRTPTSVDSTTISLLPAQATQGVVNIVLSGANPATPIPGQKESFNFTISSLAASAGTFTLIPVISIADWQNKLQLFDTSPQPQPLANNSIQLLPGQTKGFSAVLDPVPTQPSNASFTLSVTASASGVGIGSSPQYSFTVGQPAPIPDPAVTLHAPTTDTPAIYDGTTIRMPAGSALAKFSIPADFNQTGTFHLSLELTPLNANWNVSLFAFSTASQYKVPDNIPLGGSKVLEFTIQPGQNPSSSAQLVFRVKRDESTGTQFAAGTIVPFALALVQ